MKRLGGILAIGLLAVTALCGCDDAVRGIARVIAREAERPDPDYRPPAPKAEGARIDATQISEEPAFVGEDGVDVYGYPRRKPDQVAILNLLRLRRFDTLERWMTHYQAEFERDFRKEDWPDAAVSAFFVGDPKLGIIIGEWIARSPSHFAPWLARGNHRFKMAQHFRGGDWAYRTSKAQFASMAEYHQAAARDFDKALSINPKLLGAYRRKLQMARSTPRLGSERALLDAGTKQCPACYNIRSYYMTGLAPRWGGSLAKMEAFASEVQPLLGDNPKLATLSGYPHWERCRSAGEDERKRALRACDAAIATGSIPLFLIEKADLFDSKTQPREVLQLLDRALAQSPQHRVALRDRYFARIQAKNYVGAAEDLVASRHLEPTREKTAEAAKWLVDMLRFEGDQLYKAQKHAEAMPYFQAAQKLAPDDNDLRARAAWALRGVAPEKVDAELAARPDDYDLRLQKDHALASQRKFSQVVEMWDEFIARHPKDPRPYSERGGAHWHLRNQDKAIADMQRACDLGLDKGCKDAEKMRRISGR